MLNCIQKGKNQSTAFKLQNMGSDTKAQETDCTNYFTETCFAWDILPLQNLPTLSCLEISPSKHFKAASGPPTVKGMLHSQLTQHKIPRGTHSIPTAEPLLLERLFGLNTACIMKSISKDYSTIQDKTNLNIYRQDSKQKNLIQLSHIFQEIHKNVSLKESNGFQH